MKSNVVENRDHRPPTAVHMCSKFNFPKYINEKTIKYRRHQEPYATKKIPSRSDFPFRELVVLTDMPERYTTPETHFAIFCKFLSFICRVTILLVGFHHPIPNDRKKYSNGETKHFADNIFGTVDILLVQRFNSGSCASTLDLITRGDKIQFGCQNDLLCTWPIRDFLPYPKNWKL